MQLLLSGGGAGINSTQTMTDEELKQREQEKEAQLREALAKKNALGHKTLPSLNESETKNNHHDSTTDA